MPPSRVEVIEQGEFLPREWLRREVLWGSLIFPPSVQVASWISGLEGHYLSSSNLSRVDVYDSLKDDVEAQSMAFFNMGKQVASLILPISLFKAWEGDSGDRLSIGLDVQAESVDKVLGHTATNDAGGFTSASMAYDECSRIVKSVREAGPGQFGNKQRLLRASQVMVGVASKQASAWIEESHQNAEDTLPLLTIHNGGTPRSGGPRVALLSSVFLETVNSAEFMALSQ